MNQQSDVSDVRRKLLKAVVYAPPVILGSMVATPRTVMGALGDAKTCDMVSGPPVIITISSGTNACCPCIVGSVKYDPAKCGKEQCKKSCGSNCPPGMIANIKCKDFCKNCGFTVPGCKKPCNCKWNAKKGKYKCK